ncbi:carbon-nitrogen hydrolase family protein [Brevibacterium litoralis]|uniref:carbon-nitrogen hydrolase family protein n=1 Tax=Brevibacterium litoralis TaxID=3138935 RepID=UPI0032EF82B7
MKISLVQQSSHEDAADNLSLALAAIARAAQEGADLVVLPEAVMYHSADTSTIAAQAQPLDGAFVTALAEAAAAHGVWVISNVYEKVEGAADGGDVRPYNTNVVLDRSGALVATYRKVHLYDAFGYKESDYVRPTAEIDPLVVEIEGVKVGVSICYDLRFPEWARTLVDAGAQVLLYNSAWVSGPRKEDHWNVLARARAIENTVFTAALTQGPPLATGGSVIVDPTGAIVGELGATDGILTRDVSVDAVEAARVTNPTLANRRL